MLRKIAILSFFVLMLLPALQAQTRTIRGKIISKGGDALIGATVAVNGSSVGTISDVDGKYTLEIPSSSKSLTFSYIGYITQIVTLSSSSSVIDVTMEEDSEMLEEVVVVGYGVQKRTDVTGSVVSVKADDLKNMPSPNIIQSLQGKMPGLNVTMTSNSVSDDNSGTSFRIRGQRSINRDASPLIILDGIQYNGFLSEINPDDIESIEVLKDASSAAIYGSKAANGVILVSSKKGRIGKPTIAFSSTFSISNAINKPRMMSGEEFYKSRGERFGNSVYDNEQYEKGINTDWLDLVLQTGFSHNYNLSVSGGTEKTKYFISGNGSFNEGVAKNDTYNRYSLRANIDTEITSWLKFGTSSTFTYADRPGKKVNLDQAMRMSPLAEPYDENGKLVFYPDGNDASRVNPFDALNVEKEDVARSFSTVNYLQVDFPFIKGLSYKLMGGYDYRTRLVETYSPMASTAQGEKVNGEASVLNQYKQNWSLENILSYNQSFGKHNLFLTAVYSANESLAKYHNLSGVGFPGDSRGDYQFADAKTLNASDTYTKRTAVGMMFRANYNFDNRYLFTFTVRRDGDSAFGKNNKYGTFPSLAIGWNMEGESFMKNLTWLDRSKLRLSFGKNGNQAINPYDAMASMATLDYLDNNGNTLNGYYANKITDPSLSWETTRQWNVGWDYSFLKGRISGSLDAYFSHTYDLLLNKVIPQINGVNNILQNIGKTQTRGIEFQISTINVQTKSFMWTTDFNISHDKSKILDLGLYDEAGNPTDLKGSNWFIGEDIKVYYRYEFDGIWQENDDILHSHMPTAKPGDVKVVDWNHNGEIDPDDRHIVGKRTPDYRIGMTNTLSYKGLTFSFLFNMVHGVTRSSEYTKPYFDGVNNICQRTWWTPENPINTYPANRDDANPYGVSLFGKMNDASFIRLSDISLSYQVPQQWIKRLSLTNLEVFGNVKNVFTITDYVGLDPELTGDFTTPPMRTFILGLRVSL